MVSLRQLQQNVIIDGAAVLTVTRLLSWAAHCAFRVPATVEIGTDGPRMRLLPHARKYGSTSLYMKRLGFEPYLEFVSEFVRAGDSFWDVGANFGVYSLVAASRRADVVAFEPGVDALTQLRANLALNPTLRVQIVDHAVSAESGSAQLHHVGGPTTFSLGGDSSQQVETVATITLDGWAANRAVDFIKIDVEGHEPFVLKGAENVLSTQRPIVLFESSSSALARNGAHAYDSFECLSDLGYDLFELRGSRRLHQVTEPFDDNFFAVHAQSRLQSRIASFADINRR